MTRKRPSSHSSRSQADDGPTQIDDGPTRLDNEDALGGAAIERPLGMEHDTVSNPVELDVSDAAEDTYDDGPTAYRGDKPPRPSSRRLSPTLMRIFKRRREQIGLSVEQVARLAGIEAEELRRFEGTAGSHRIFYDHAVVLGRVLGVRPEDMPGLRPLKDRDAVGTALNALGTALAAGPILTFEGKTGERFGGDLEKLTGKALCAVRIGDSSLGVQWPRGALLGFVGDTQPRHGDVVLLSHRKTRQLLMRRLDVPTYVGLAEWQEKHPASSTEWLPVARLCVMLPRP